MSRRRALMAHNSTSRIILPDGYRQVEYLESDGKENKYIIIPNAIFDNDRTLTVEIGITQSNANNILFTRYIIGYGIQTNPNAHIQCRWGNVIVNSPSSYGYRTLLNCQVSTDGCLINGEYIGATGGNGNQLTGLTLFCYMQNDTRVYPGASLIGKLMLTNADNVELFLVPCLDANDRPCMYDTVSKQTFYNAGTGEFQYGGII